MDKLQIDTNEQNGVVNIVLVGEMDASSAIQADETVQKFLDENKVKFCIDLSGLEYISSAGLGLFMSLHTESQEKGGKSVIHNLTPKVSQVFEISGLSDILNLYENRTNAVVALSE